MFIAQYLSSTTAPHFPFFNWSKFSDYVDFYAVLKEIWLVEKNYQIAISFNAFLPPLYANETSFKMLMLKQTLPYFFSAKIQVPTNVDN